MRVPHHMPLGTSPCTSMSLVFIILLFGTGQIASVYDGVYLGEEHLFACMSCLCTNNHRLVSAFTQHLESISYSMRNEG